MGTSIEGGPSARTVALRTRSSRPSASPGLQVVAELLLRCMLPRWPTPTAPCERTCAPRPGPSGLPATGDSPMQLDWFPQVPRSGVPPYEVSYRSRWIARRNPPRMSRSSSTRALRPSATRFPYLSGTTGCVRTNADFRESRPGAHALDPVRRLLGLPHERRPGRERTRDPPGDFRAGNPRPVARA